MEPIWMILGIVFLAGFVSGLWVAFLAGTDKIFYNRVWFSIDPQHELTATRSLGAYKGLSIRCYPPSEKPSVVVITCRMHRFGRNERTPQEHLENLMGILKAKDIRILDYGCY